MFYINVILRKVPVDTQLIIKELLEDNGSAECECTFDVSYNVDNGHVFISFDRFAASLQEALNDITYELDGAALLNYMTSIERM